MAEVTIANTTLDVTGTPGTLNISSGWLVNINITSESEVVTFAQDIATEAKKAWPNLSITITEGK